MVSSKDVLNNGDHAALGFVVYVIMTQFTDKEGSRDEARAGHLAHVAKLEMDGKLFAAGPTLKEDGSMAGKGMIAVKAKSIEEAREMADADPFHQSGFREYTIVPWKINEGGFDLKVRFADGSFEFD